MKAQITTAQAMSHPDVAMTINTLGQMADELREKVDRQDKLLREQLTICKYLSHSICMTDETGADTNPDNIVESCITAIEKELKV